MMTVGWGGEVEEKYFNPLSNYKMQCNLRVPLQIQRDNQDKKRHA